MARKESITIQMISDTAFEMTREEGFANVTARKVAAKAGCSTQPIFRVYKNMEELWTAVYERAIGFFQDYYSLYPRIGKTPFSNLGMAYIAFAREESHLFELLFLAQSAGDTARVNKKSMYELLNGSEGNVVHEITLAKEAGCANPSDLFMKMWIYIHGAACMSLTGDYDLTDRETLMMLEDFYKRYGNEA
ncbi:MAG: TetR/AcrR family transcriptional regulator [Lachnospiraceae bacterium]|nr:TetR/AcrR family transcriptional regulator [Lachnospiraceae bacterium]